MSLHSIALQFILSSIGQTAPSRGFRGLAPVATKRLTRRDSLRVLLIVLGLGLARLAHPAHAQTFSTNSASLNTARYDYTATLLTSGPNSGKILVVGGLSAGTDLKSTELYDPATDTFSTNSASLNTARDNHTATLLTSGPNSGKILVVGGSSGSSGITELTSTELYDPATNTFSTNSASLTTAREGHTATLLTSGPNSGKVLIMGGYSGLSYLTSTELYDPATNTFSTNSASLNTVRYEHTATLLTSGPNSGKILVVGGSGTGSSTDLKSTELYDPATNTFSPNSASLNTVRYEHTATLLTSGPNSGKILVTGGIGLDTTTYPKSTELYDPATNTFSPNSAMTTARYEHTATLLTSGPNSGKVLVIGGFNGGYAGNTLASTELYDPATNTFSTNSASLTTARYEHTATLLTSGSNSGKVLIVGGYNGSTALTSTELYDPATNTFSANSASLATARYGHTATLLTSGPNSGKILVVGGSSGSAYLKSTELYDPATNTFSTSASLNTRRYKHTATLLTSGPNSGKILVVGGSSGSTDLTSTELYDPATNTFSTNSASLNTARYEHTATLLTSGPNSGKILIIGGLGSSTFLTSTELYDPATNTFSTNSANLSVARYGHTATLLTSGPNSGKILVAGGSNVSTDLASTELYDPATNTFSTNSASLTVARHGHTATLLTSGSNSGKILIMGGYNETDGYLTSTEFYTDPLPADVLVTLTNGVTTVTPGTSTTYVLTVTNTGLSDVANVSFALAVPANATFVAANQTSGPVCTLTPPALGGGGVVTGNWATLPATSAAAFTITVQVPASATGTLSSSVTVTDPTTAATYDPNPVNNSDSDSDALTPTADVSVTNVAAPAVVSVGSNVTYTITLHNGGPSDAASVSLSAPLPATTTLVAFSQTSGPTFTLSAPAVGGSGTVTATAPSLAANTDAIFSLVTQIKLNTANQTVLNAPATAVTVATDPNPANNSSTATATITNQPPVLRVPVPQLTNEDVPLTFSTTGGNALSASDAEAGSAPLPLSLTVTHGTFALASTAGLTANSGNAAGNTSVTLTGPLAALNNALNGLVFTPDANYNGPALLTLTFSDGNSTTTASVPLTVTAVDDPPVATNQSLTTPEHTPLAITLQATDIDSPTLTYSVVTQPAHGTLSGSGANLTYTPASNYSGADSFTFKADDGSLVSNLATISITVTPVNDAPVAQNDTYSLNGSQPLTVAAPGVLGNDSDTEGNPLQAVVVTQPAHGSLTLNADGSFTYTPVVGFNGSDSFTYKANDGAADSSIAMVSVTVTGNVIPALTLTVVPNAISENYGPTAALATLTRNTPTTQALRVALLNSNLKALKVPASVVIPARASSVTFFVAALDNRIINKAQTAQLTARATGYKNGTAKLTIADNGKVSQDLKLTLAGGTTYIEQVGGQTVTGTITLSGTPLKKNLTITLVSSDPKRGTVPASVLLKAGQSKVNFSFRVLDNTVADGPHQVWLTARSLGFGTLAVLVNVLDNDGPLLRLTLPKTSIAENAGSLVATVTRLHVPTTASLTVSLSSSDKTRITVPATVTIPAGKASATFKVTIINNKVVDGNHVIILTASKSGLLAGTSKLTILDDDKPASTTPRSTMGLSTATASAANGIQLRFTGALDADSAQDAMHYSVTVNGVAVEVQSLSYAAATHTVTLTLTDGAVQVGDSLVVSWQDVQDAEGRSLAGSTGTLTAH